jgi:regulator of protease activity HflC (stomatin/prohibitin superfamily)
MLECLVQEPSLELYSMMTSFLTVTNSIFYSLNKFVVPPKVITKFNFPANPPAWGITCTKFEIQRFEPENNQVKRQLELQMEAERR